MKTFKISLLCLLVCIMSVLSFAQTPEKLSYQAVFRNTYDRLITEQNIPVQITILQGSAEGTVVFQETQVAKTNKEGIASFEIGTGTPVVGALKDIDWKTGPYFVKAEMDPEGGDNYAVVGTVEFLSVPYALYAKNAGNSFSRDYNDLKNAPEIPVVPENISELTNDSKFRAAETQELVLNGKELSLTDSKNVVEIPVLNTFDGTYANVVNKPVGKNTGDLLYWDASKKTWNTIAPGAAEYVLTMGEDSIPVWKERPGMKNLPVVTTKAATDVIAETATLNGEVFSAAAVTEQGFYYGIDAMDNKVTVTPSEELTVAIAGLKDGSKYNFVAYAENANGIVYGDTLDFTTEAFRRPTIVVAAATDLTKTTAKVLATITHNGFQTIKERGFYISNNLENFIDSAVKYTVNATTDTFSYTFEGLNPETQYYYMSYAVNSVGDAMSSINSFTTKPIVLLATVTTGEVKAKLADLQLSGQVSDKGKAEKMTEMGFYYSEVADAVKNGKKVVSTSTTDNFTATLADMKYSRTYYIVAYAINEAGEAVGSEVSFVHVDNSFKKCGDTLNDYDGNKYRTVQIGVQCWMQENLKVQHYADGKAITSGMVVYSDKTYGLGDNVYYNWTTATRQGNVKQSDYNAVVQGVCPDGWHIPAYGDIHELCTEIDSTFKGVSVPTTTTNQPIDNKNHLCIKLCQPHANWSLASGTPLEGTPAWATANDKTDFNASGFSALPFGYANNCSSTDIKIGPGNQCGLITVNSSSASTSNGRTWGIKPALTGITHEKANTHGWSVRCVCDKEFERPFKNCGDILKDIDGNSYKTVKMGKDCWMAENLRTTTNPQTGKAMTQLYPTAEKTGMVTGNIQGVDKYVVITNEYLGGTQVFYNWATANYSTSYNTNKDKIVQGICPEGWHIPTMQNCSDMCNSVDPNITLGANKWMKDNYSSTTNTTGKGNAISSTCDSRISSNKLAVKLLIKDADYFNRGQYGTAVTTPIYSTVANSPGYIQNTNPEEKDWNASGFSARPNGYISKDGSGWYYNGVFSILINYAGSATTSAYTFKLCSDMSGACFYSWTNSENYGGYAVRCVNDKKF